MLIKCVGCGKRNRLPEPFGIQDSYKCSACKGVLLRPGNRALQYLAERYEQFGVKQIYLVSMLPICAGRLYDLSESLRTELKHDLNEIGFCPFSAETKADGGHDGFAEDWDLLLLNCIFDLISGAYFQQVFARWNNKDLVSALVDALTYEATGEHASLPTESDVLCGVTHKHRGVAKYGLAAREQKHAPATVALRVFGKEVAAIFGKGLDFFDIVSVAPFAMTAQAKGKWAVKFLLDGSLPTDEDKKNLEATLEGAARHLEKMLKDLEKSAGGIARAKLAGE